MRGLRGEVRYYFRVLKLLGVVLFELDVLVLRRGFVEVRREIGRYFAHDVELLEFELGFDGLLDRGHVQFLKLVVPGFQLLQLRLQLPVLFYEDLVLMFYSLHNILYLCCPSRWITITLTPKTSSPPTPSSTSRAPSPSPTN